MPAPAGMDAGTASQLIPGVRRTQQQRANGNEAWLGVAGRRFAKRGVAARARCAPYSAYGTHLCKAIGGVRGQPTRRPALL